MDWSMDEPQARKLLFESCNGSLARVGTAIVDDPKDTPCVVVGRASHDLLNKTIEWCDAGGCFATAKDTGMMNVESSDVGPGSAPLVLMFDTHRTLGGSGQRRMFAATGLNAGLLVSRNDKFIAFEGLPFPGTLIQIQDPGGFDGEAGVAGEDPTAVVPGANGVLMEPPPDGTS
jgi:hypothetical protein